LPGALAPLRGNCNTGWEEALRVKIALPWTIALAALAFALYVAFGNLHVEVPASAPSLDNQTVAEPNHQTPEHPPQPKAKPRPLDVPQALAAPNPELPRSAVTSMPPESCREAKLCPPCPPSNHEKCTTSTELQSCLKRVAQCESWDTLVTESVRRQSVLSARRATISFLLQDDLGLAAEQIEWVNEAACALRELRWHAVDQMHQVDEESNAPRLRINSDRKEILADMEKMLGTPTYTRLREMGGIGLLNDTLECADDPSGP
jgi:hypothetical protein